MEDELERGSQDATVKMVPQGYPVEGKDGMYITNGMSTPELVHLKGLVIM